MQPAVPVIIFPKMPELSMRGVAPEMMTMTPALLIESTQEWEDAWRIQ